MSRSVGEQKRDSRNDDYGDGEFSANQNAGAGRGGGVTLWGAGRGAGRAREGGEGCGASRVVAPDTVEKLQ